MAPKLEVGTVIAERYQLERLLGQGGMASVWEAKHLMTRRLVAMKFLHAALDARADMRRRFLREAQAAAAVDHPNVVTVHDVFQLDDGMFVLVMARLEGETFAARLVREAPLSLEEAVAVLLPVVSAVGSAHARGIIHRDLKPENVFLSRESGSTVVRVLDFGIAKLTQQEESGDLTTTGTVLGTPCYMAPEQAYAEKNIDHRADIWSLGAMLYEALTGMRPIEGDTLGQIVKFMLTQAITPLYAVAPDVPNEITTLVMRMLRVAPEGRPDDLREVHTVLARYSPARTPSFGPPISGETQVLVASEGKVLQLDAPGGPGGVITPVGSVKSALARQATLPDMRQTESWKPLAVATPKTTGAHSISVTPRRRSRWVLGAMAGIAGVAVLIGAWLLRAPSPDAGKKAAAGPAASPALGAAAIQQPPQPSAPVQPPASSAVPVVSVALVSPSAGVAAQNPPTAAARPGAAVHPHPPAAASASAARTVATLQAAKPAEPPPAPTTTPAPASTPKSGLHEAVPF